MSRRGTTPSLEAAQQTHIDDLVQRNRNLEHTLKKLKDELALEKTRSKNAINDIHAKWTQDQDAWKEGCDSLQSLHRIEQLRLQVALEAEKSNVLREQGIIRREKVANVQRDFVITTFQMREGELEGRVEELEEEMEEAGIRHEEELRTLKGRVKELSGRLKAQEARLNTEEQEIDSRDTEISNLHKALAEQQAAAESNAAKLERTTLQLDTERTKNVELQRANDDYKRTNQDLTRQLDKWQSLETKGGEEVEALRKQKVDLDIQLQVLQSQLKKREEENTKQTEKDRKKVEKLKVAVDDWTTHGQFLEKEVKDYKKTVAKLEKELEKARAELQIEQTRAKSPQKRKRSPSPPVVETSEDEVEHEVLQILPSPPAASGSRNKPKSVKPASRTARRPTSKETSVSGGDEVVPKAANKDKGKARAADSDVEIAQKPRSKVTAKSKGKKAGDSEVEEIPKPTTKGKKKETITIHDIDSESGSQSQPPAKPKSKRKPQSPDDNAPQHAAPKRKKKDTSGDETGVPSKAAPARNLPSRTASVQSIATTADVDAEDSSASALTGQPRKKRKINLFADKSSLPSLNFGSQNGLNIPTVLSPVREEDAPRATVSVLGRLSSFGRR